MTSIHERKKPVIAFGVIGPPESCIITGYDEKGEVLIGWNLFQVIPEFTNEVEFEPSGYFRKPHWFKETPGLIIIREKHKKPSAEEIYQKALEWAIKVIRTPKIREFHNGLASYTVWAEKMQQDEVNDLPAEEPKRTAYDDFMDILDWDYDAEEEKQGSLF